MKPFPAHVTNLPARNLFSQVLGLLSNFALTTYPKYGYASQSNSKAVLEVKRHIEKRVLLRNRFRGLECEEAP